MTNDDDKPHQSRHAGRRSGSAQAAASAPEAERNLVKELQNAGCNYQRALQQAWERAALDAWKAKTELADAQQRIVLNTGTQHSSAHGDWSSALRDVDIRAEGAARIEQVNQTYREKLATATTAGRSEWDQSHQNHRQALSAVAEAYAAATKEALKSYLSQIKAIWSDAEVDQIDAATLAKLAEATSHVAHSARAILRT